MAIVGTGVAMVGTGASGGGGGEVTLANRVGLNSCANGFSFDLGCWLGSLDAAGVGVGVFVFVFVFVSDWSSSVVVVVGAVGASLLGEASLLGVCAGGGVGDLPN